MVEAKNRPSAWWRASRCLAALATWLIVTLASGYALAQARPVVLTGWVQWIAANRLMLIRSDGAAVVPVDLTGVPLDQYKTLAQRDPIAVLGAVSEGNRELIGKSIVRLSESQAP